MAQAKYSATYDHKITFKMTKNFDLTSYIAIDDVSLSNHCEDTIQCDFDDDLCSYTSDNHDGSYTSDYEFARFVAPPVTPKWPGPGYDHTKQGYGGGYVYLSGFPSKSDMKRTAQLQTPIMPLSYSKSSNSCISLFSYVSASDAELSVNVRLFSRTGQPTTIKILQIQDTTETKWKRHYADVDGSMFKDRNEFLFIIEGTTKKAETIIAIDDITYSPYECEFKHQFKCANGKKVHMDEVCNFHDDCGDNSDESECGSCDFEKDACSWKNGTDMYNSKLGGSWVPTLAGSRHDLPKTDGSKNETGHFLVIKKSPYSDKSLQFVNTELTRYYTNYKYQFKDAYFTCRIEFDHYMSSSFNRSHASIELWAGSDDDSSIMKLHYDINQAKMDKWITSVAWIGGFPHSFVVNLKATFGSENETLAIDNIQFKNCSFPPPVKVQSDCPDDRAVMCNTTHVCISPDDFCDFQDDCGDNWDESYALCSSFNEPTVPVSCAFEKSLDTCGMTVENKTNIYDNWRISRGYSFYFAKYHSPSADHTT